MTASIDTPAKKKGDEVDIEAEARDVVLDVSFVPVAGTYMSHTLASSYAATAEHLAESAHLVESPRHMADWS